MTRSIYAMSLAIALGATTTAAAAAQTVPTRPVAPIQRLGERIECPAELPDGWGLGMSLRSDQSIEDHQYSGPLPEGWDFYRFHGYSDWNYVRTGHSIGQAQDGSRNLLCAYGVEGSSGPITLLSVMRPEPGGRSCQAVDGFSFRCRMSRVMRHSPGDQE